MAENDKSLWTMNGKGSSGNLSSKGSASSLCEESTRLMERRGGVGSGERGGEERERVPELVLECNGPSSQCKEDRKSVSLGRTPSAYRSGQEAFLAVLQSWASKRFMSGVAILFPIAVTFYITWWFFTFVDGFFYPIYRTVFHIDIIGLGFVTTFIFIFCVGVFVSSYVGSSIVWLGECIIKQVPLIKHIYSASKQISNAISPDQNVNAFKEVVIIRHPRIGEYAMAFITSTVTLLHDSGEEEQLHSVYVPTNHVYIGDVFLVNAKEVFRPQLSVREGIEIVVSGGMSMPSIIRPLDRSMSGLSPSVGPMI